MKKRIAALLLAALMLTGILASCVNRKPNTPDNSGNDSGSETKGDDWDFSRFDDIKLPEGTVVNIMSRAYQRHANEITVETEDGK